MERGIISYIYAKDKAIKDYEMIEKETDKEEGMEKYYWIIKIDNSKQYEIRLDGVKDEKDAIYLYERSWNTLHRIDKERYIVYDLVCLEQSSCREFPRLYAGYTPIKRKEDLTKE